MTLYKCTFFSSVQTRRCTSAPRYTTTTCTFDLYIRARDEFVFDKLGNGDASDSDWTPWFQLLPYNKECVSLSVVKHSNTGRLRQEGTFHSAQLRGLLTGTVIRENPNGCFLAATELYKGDMDF